MPTQPSLDDLGILSVTDKCSLAHDYLRHYDRVFGGFRDAPITVLEIGIFQGGSLKMLERYFSAAKIVGVDINEDCRAFAGGRRFVEIASQAEPDAMAALGARHNPTIVIDDGSHRADHILISFQALFPFVQPGGVYIVEDMAAHGGDNAMRFRGDAPMSPQQYFLNFANRVVCPTEQIHVDRVLYEMIDSVEFISGLVVIRKRASFNEDHIKHRASLVEVANNHWTWGWLSGYIQRARGNTEWAIECAQKALDLSPTTSRHYLELATALSRAGRLEDAAAIAAKGLELPRGDPGARRRMEQIVEKGKK